MRWQLLLITASAVLVSSAVSEAKRGPVGPLKCATSGGESKDPFYGVNAFQNMMPPINKPRPIVVSGQYRLDMRSGRLSLVEARPTGINGAILLLKLRLIRDPSAGGHCLPFKGSFAARAAQQVQVTDWRGHSITVDISRPQ